MAAQFNNPALENARSFGKVKGCQIGHTQALVHAGSPPLADFHIEKIMEQFSVRLVRAAGCQHEIIQLGSQIFELQLQKLASQGRKHIIHFNGLPSE